MLFRSLTPIRICVRGHIEQTDTTHFGREKTANKLLSDSKKTEINDKKQLLSRRIREPVKIPHVKQRKIKLFEKINAELFQSLGGLYGNNMPLIITEERMDLFERICDRINILLPLAITELDDIRFKESVVFESELFIIRDGEGEGIDKETSTLYNKNPRDLKRMFFELFPEKKIVC